MQLVILVFILRSFSCVVLYYLVVVLFGFHILLVLVFRELQNVSSCLGPLWGAAKMITLLFQWVCLYSARRAAWTIGICVLSERPLSAVTEPCWLFSLTAFVFCPYCTYHFQHTAFVCSWRKSIRLKLTYPLSSCILKKVHIQFHALLYSYCISLCMSFNNFVFNYFHNVYNAWLVGLCVTYVYAFFWLRVE